MPEPVVQRIVPGAPPPAPLSKSQKKKRKAKKPSESTPESPTVLDPPPANEKAPESAVAREDSIAPEPAAQPESLATPLPEEELGLKPSPIVELITKRLKATTKKIVRHFQLVDVNDELEYRLINFLGADICLCGHGS